MTGLYKAGTQGAPMNVLSNLPTDIKDLAKEIQASLAAEAPIIAAYLQAKRDADGRYEEATSLAHAEFTKAYREATATFEAIEIPARNVRDAATRTAAKVRQKELDAVRIQTGHLLLAAKKKVDKGGWQAWCKTNVQRTRSDIRAMIALAESSDPVAAREAEKANTRARVQRHRASAVTSAPVTAVPEQPITLSPAMVQQAPLAVRPNAPKDGNTKQWKPVKQSVQEITQTLVGISQYLSDLHNHMSAECRSILYNPSSDIEMDYKDECIRAIQRAKKHLDNLEVVLPPAQRETAKSKPDANFTTLVLKGSDQIISTRKIIEKMRETLPECELDTNGDDLMSFRELLITLRKEAAALCNELQETVKTKRLVGCGVEHPDRTPKEDAQ
jgi:hypothetical protein